MERDSDLYDRMQEHQARLMTYLKKTGKDKDFLLSNESQNNVSRKSFNPNSFNISDLKCDKTQYFESPQKAEPVMDHAFEPSARSTVVKHTLNSNKALGMMLDIDDIMRSSACREVQDKYRQSIAFIPEERISEYKEMRTTMGNENDSILSGNSSWSQMKVNQCSFQGKNISLSDESFKPAEEMVSELYKDQIQHDKEYADIPETSQTVSNSLWEDKSRINQTEMSFGAYCRQFNNDEDIDEICEKKDTPQRFEDRVPLVDLTNNEMSLRPSNISEYLGRMKNSSETLSMSVIDKMMQSTTIDTAMEMSKAEISKRRRQTSKYDHDLDEIFPTQDKENIKAKKIEPLIPKKFQTSKFDQKLDQMIAEFEAKEKQAKEKKSRRSIKTIHEEETPLSHHVKETSKSESNEPRGQKRRSSVVYVPAEVALAKYIEKKKTPEKIKQKREKQATNLKPAISESAFKIPESAYDMTVLSSKTREYSSRDEKLSLPSYNLARAETLPGPSRISRENGQMKRASSQMSTASDFLDDNLPLLLSKSQRKLSFPSTKLFTNEEIQLTIRNGSDRKLPLNVRTDGIGFTVSPCESFRMLAHEVRTFNVKFNPSKIGPHAGYLIFELTTNKQVHLKIPLFGFGGHANIKIEGLMKAPIGPQFVTMGLVKYMNTLMERTLKFTNNGSLPGFVAVTYERSKMSCLISEDSIKVSPGSIRLMPGESKEIMIKFKPKKEDARKIVNLNKEVTVIGELFIIMSDESTRLRLLKKPENAPGNLLEWIPDYFPSQETMLKSLSSFNENFDMKSINNVIQRISTHTVMLTLDRNLDETQIVDAHISMSDDEMTLCEYDPEVTINSDFDGEDVDVEDDDAYFLDSKHFRIYPASLKFQRDECLTKRLKVQSKSQDTHFVEIVSSHPTFVQATKNCGKLLPGGSTDVNVSVTKEAFDCLEQISVTIMVENARIKVPVKFA